MIYLQIGTWSFINNTSISDLKKRAGTIVAYSESYEKEDQEKNWYLGILLHQSWKKICIAPCHNIDTTQHINEYISHGGKKLLNDCLVFNPKNPLKIYFLNKIDNLSSIGNDGFIQSNVAGPDRIDIYKNNFLSSELHAFIRSIEKTNPLLYVIKKSMNVLFKSCKKKKYFGSTIYIPRTSMKDHEFIKVTQNKINSYSGFAFPLFNSKTKTIDCDREVSFAILSYQDAKHIIKQGKVKKDYYIKFLMEKNNHIIKVKVHNVKDKWLVIEDGNDETDTKKMDSHYVWERKGHQLGIWKSIPTVDILNVNAIKYVLNKTYGNFGFERDRTKCFGLNIYTGKELFSFLLHLY